jgi:hypothetical protein
LGVFVVLPSAGSAQAHAGVDLYSRYIFRGTDFGNAASLQPSLSYTTGAFTAGVWGAYALTGGYSEADLWATYGIGPVTLYVTDYYIPSVPPAQPFFNYSDKGGAHVVEVGAGVTGPEGFPLSASGFVNILNDASNSIYIQLGYPVTEELALTVGLTPAKGVYTPVSTLQPVSKAGLVSAGVTVTKTLKLSESFSIPFNAQYLMNPYAEMAYLIIGIGL